LPDADGFSEVVKRVLVIAAVVLTALATADTAAAARLTCANQTGGFGEREVRFGPAWVRAVNQYSDPAFFSTRYVDDFGAYWAKAPLSLRKGVRARVSIVREDRPFADFAFGGDNAGDIVRVNACRRSRQRAEHGDARYTSWAGGYLVKGPRCVDVAARNHRTGQVHRATLSFGMGDACERRPQRGGEGFETLEERNRP
jgi:hypothetical protein